MVHPHLVKKIDLPLLEGHTPAAKVFARDDLMAAGSVVARQGNTLRLVSMTAIAAKASRESDLELSFQLWDVTGPPMAQVPPELAGAIGFDFDAPDIDAFNRLCSQLRVPLLVGPNPFRGNGQTLITSYLNLHHVIRSRLDRRVYFCQLGKEPYTESEYNQLGGTCPSHGARLV